MVGYERPTELGAALALLAEAPRVVLAGGTDFYPARVGQPLDEPVLDVSAIAGLRGIEQHPDHIRIGATTTWTDLIRAELPPWIDGLRLAAREIGGVQIQNAGTLAGNVCNASPAADGIPCLLALDAEVVLASAAGERRVRVAEFVEGNRRTLRRPDELVVAFHLPRPRGRARSTFLKLGARRYLVISIVMVAVVLERDGDRVRAARVAVGACSAAARRLPALESALLGAPATAALADCVDAAHLAPLSPIGDVRGSAAYRREAALELLRRALVQVAA